MTCYAAELGLCQGGLSREHYFSEAVLRLIGSVHILSGTAWQEPETTKDLPIGGLAVRVLCRKHNAELSPLDETGLAFAAALKAASARLDNNAVLAEEIEVDGDQLERWLLKVIAGAIAGGIVRRGAQPFAWQPPLRWLELLFGRRSFDGGSGLHVHPTRLRRQHTLGLQPLWSGGECTGGIIHVLGLHLVITTSSGDGVLFLREASTGEETESVRRPRHITVVRANGPWRLNLNWTGFHCHYGIEFRQSGPYVW